MSGPVGVADAPPTEAQASAVRPACVEITPSRESVVGAMRVRRALPRIGRRTVGAWCFADPMGPELDTERNARQGPLITTDASRLPVHVVPTDEERMIARHTLQVLRRHR